MRACAYIVGPTDGPGAAVRDLALTCGFVQALPYAGLAAAEQQAKQTPVCFFLFAAVDDVTALQATAQEIRFAATRRIRFSPLIYFSESPQVETIQACIDMGFDDIITLPFTRERVMGRLRRQIDTPLVYFETASYFGPDRRNRLPTPAVAARRGAGGVFRRMEIMRTLGNGVTVLRDDTHTAPPAAA